MGNKQVNGQISSDLIFREKLMRTFKTEELEKISVDWRIEKKEDFRKKLKKIHNSQTAAVNDILSQEFAKLEENVSDVNLNQIKKDIEMIK
jgi:hypothetical protein